MNDLETRLANAEARLAALAEAGITCAPVTEFVAISEDAKRVYAEKPKWIITTNGEALRTSDAEKRVREFETAVRRFVATQPKCARCPEPAVIYRRGAPLCFACGDEPAMNERGEALVALLKLVRS